MGKFKTMSKKSKVSLARCARYEAAEVQAAVKASVEALGGMVAFVHPGESVLLKPNLLSEAPPEAGVTTHPEVVRAVIRLLKPLTDKIFCGDAPSVWGDPQDVDRVYEATGIREICQQEGVELVYFNRPRMHKGYPLADWVGKCEKMISLPKFKTHGFTVLTAGIKNLYGCVVGMHKAKIHRENPRPLDLSRALLDIYELTKPTLTILDGIVSLEGEGPGTSGTLRQTDLIAASSDALALDTILAVVMGLYPQDVPTNVEGYKRGLGTSEVEEIEIAGESLKSFLHGSFQLPKATLLNRAPAWAAGLVKVLVKMRPVVLRKRCRVCGVCQKSCPVGAIATKKERVMIDARKCILCLCCQEVCPHRAIEVKKSFFLKRMGL